MKPKGESRPTYLVPLASVWTLLLLLGFPPWADATTPPLSVFDGTGAMIGTPAHQLRPAGEYTATEFLPNIQVNDDASPEHREPVMAWGADPSTIYIAYCERHAHYNPELVMFSKSTDGGLTWLAEAIRINDTQPNAVMTPAIATWGADTVFVVWSEMGFAPDYNYEIRFSRSFDRGQTGSASTVVHPISPSEDLYRPGITLTGTRIVVSYWKQLSYPEAYPMVVYSDDLGESWSDPIVVCYGPHGKDDGAAPGIVYNAVDDEIGLVYESVSNRIFMCISYDHGETWSGPYSVSDTSPTSVRYPDIDCFNGVYYVVWHDNRNGQYDCDVWFNKSDSGTSWGGAIRVNDTLQGNQYEPHIAVGADGKIHVCWIWNIPFQTQIDLYYSCSEDDGMTWEMPSVRVNDIAYVIEPYCAWTSDIRADAYGSPLVAWNDGRETGYYDDIYFSRTESTAFVEPSGMPGLTKVEVLGSPGPAPVIRLTIPEEGSPRRVFLLEASGRRLAALGTAAAGATTQLHPTKHSPGLASGVYYVLLGSGRQAVAAKRIVVVR